MNDLNNTVAIVGMSLRFPKATTPAEFWRNLAGGRDCGRVLSKEELLELGVSREKMDSPEYVFRSYDLDNIDQFDARFFGMSPREARMADPQMRLMLETAHECIEDSGHVLQGTNTGLYFGVADHKYWLYHNLYQSALEEENEVAKRIFAFKDFFATQVSHKLGLNGPSISLYSACSTGLLATHEACNHLLLYDCDYALAGGCEVLLGAGYKYVEGGLSSRDGYVRAFDKDASGTIFGSGVGVVMLRRLADAIADGDNIYAVIRSTAVNNDGNQKVGYIAPGVKGQMGVIHEAIERAGISARDVSYVEAHGTGTKVGDPIEVESLCKVYRKYTDANQFCAIGSVKTNVGHLSIAAGAAGLIKTALMLSNRQIPPILHYKEANPAIDFETSPFYVCRELRDWPPYEGRRIAGISAFGVGGTNVHAILEEAPEVEREPEPRPYHRLFVFGAKSEQALGDTRKRLADFLRAQDVQGELSLSDVAFSLNVGRQKYDYRAFAVAGSTQELIDACENARAKSYHVPAQSKRQVVFMFPGQGSQYVNMGLQLYEQEPVFRQHVDDCCRYAQDSLGIDVMSAMSSERVNQTEYTQISLFVISYSLARLWMHWGVKPQAMIGHSIGEYVAACLSGVFSLNDALALVAARGRLMQSMPKGSMLSVQAPRQEVSRLLEDTVCVAGENSPASCVVSGPDDAIERVKATLQRAGIKSTLLHTSHAFHSHMMDPILSAYESVVRGVTLHEAGIAFASNVTGAWITSEQARDPAYWVAQLREAVLFSKGLQTVAREDSIFIEIGPGATLCSLLGQHDLEHESLPVSSLPRAKDELSAVDSMLTALGKACCYGIDIDWDCVYGKAGNRRIPLPTYPFERKSYWIDEEQLTRPRSAPVQEAPLEHPLLGRRVASSGKVMVFENIIDKDTPKFIADHRLIETVIFPGAGYTQMGLAVGKYFIKNKKIKLDDIRFAQALMLHDGVRKVVQTIATASGEGCTFEILSRDLQAGDSVDAGAWVLHAKGKISPHSINAASMEMPALARDASSELVPLSRYYDALKFITFGPSFRAIKRLWIGKTPGGELESLGLIELPPHLHAEVEPYSFHPVLLDAAFQVIDGPKISQTGTLPVGLRNFTVYDAVPNTFYVHAIRREHTDEEYSIGQITVFAESGTVIARIEHYLQKEIADSAVADDQLAGVLFDINWEKVSQRHTKPQAAQGAWVVVGGPSLLGDRLQAALQQRNHPVLSLAHGLADNGKAVELLRRSEVDTIVFTHALCRQVQDRQVGLALSLNLMRLCQLIARSDPAMPPRLVLVTSGAQLVNKEIHVDEYDAHQATLWGMGNTLTAEHPEYRCLRADVDHTEESLDALISDLLQGETEENQIVYREGERYTPRLTRYVGGDGSKNKLRLPNGPFEVRLMRFGTFDNFSAREFIPDLLADNEVLVEMHSAALNFKETLYVLGFLNPNSRPAVDFDFGMEGAGRIKRVGAKVSHLEPGDDVIVWHNGCLSSDFVVSVDKVIRKPKALSYAEAACIPTVFMTAYYALKSLANIQRGHKVLIHAAAGGVGQVAIQIAKVAGAEVFATASQGKWAHLRKQGVEHVFDSRTLDFSDRIREITHGKGVDIVFNSLTGDFIPRSFDVLSKGGRFIEIGKRDIWSNEKAAAYRPDVNYTFFEIGEDVVSGGIGGTSVIHDLMVQILDDFERGDLQPPAMTEFAVSEIQQAYRYLSAGKNIGKVVVNFDKHQAGASRSSFVKPDKTYLVTGGLGGLGLLCADWLIAHGAQHVALTGRRAPQEDVARKIRDLNKIGINVRWTEGDVGEYEDIARIVQTIESGEAPLAGILHCAGVLDDALLGQQTEKTFENVFKPKVMGTLHLHRLTANLALDFFVCFSSVAAILDGGGQSNYAAANAFMDRLVSHRRSQGLPGLSVNWGAWADVGMAARLAERRSMDTSHFISKDEAFMALERLLLHQNAQGVVCKLGNRPATQSLSRLLLSLEQQRLASDATVGDLERVFLQNPTNSTQQNLTIFLKEQVNKVLGADLGDDVPPDAEFVNLGVDSLSMAELKNAVQHGLGRPMKMATFFANPTVARLAKHLAAEYADALGFNSAARPVAAGGSVEFVALEQSDSEETLFCFPGLNGNVFDFSDFAAQSRQKFKVQVGEINSDPAALETDIRTIAADAIHQMKRLQPKGAYALLGYSYGGVVALEIAHQLRAADEEVQLLMMVDSFPHFRHRHDQRFMSFMSALITDSIVAPMKLDRESYDTLVLQIMDTPADQLETLWQKIGREASSSARVNLDLLSRIVEAGKKRALAAYEPPKRVAGVTVQYVRAGSYPRSMALARLDGFLEEPSMQDDKYGWSQFVANEFNVRRIEAQHNEILKAKNAATILSFVEDSLRTEASRVELFA
jgi:acyl transferase domain-containing protein/NADPH:quinone reductase-like Zn-dependent oxidoreductase/thioesterase domain-containing protein/acyl carrier protein